ncbi:hypothetical protein GCM10007416_35140 [Kroppenstedtia guangzhouensis]|uniref:DUF5348 domain-containing protein n=1 Tax=Kroppenstedtia guangzhouensis TaxID=1274356 RepID=A0ABQ1H4X3_9BACL|nr:DUF5348 domain-containing protein [Kroppenstedtia guangzhouensis]GGA58944.1 hypothetical protein GCM10007416_35140 [Kroppenstedtia guangzhouensis]
MDRAKVSLKRLELRLKEAVQEARRLEYETSQDALSPEKRFEYEQLLGIGEKLEEALTRWEYLQKPVVAEGFLRKNENGRYEIGDREFTSGESIEILISDPGFDETVWVKSRVEHNGQDYYLMGYEEVPMDGLMARQRG